MVAVSVVKRRFPYGWATSLLVDTNLGLVLKRAVLADPFGVAREEVVEKVVQLIAQPPEEVRLWTNGALDRMVQAGDLVPYHGLDQATGDGCAWLHFSNSFVEEVQKEARVIRDLRGSWAVKGELA